MLDEDDPRPRMVAVHTVDTNGIVSYTAISD